MKKIKNLDCIVLVDDDESNNFLHKRIIKKLGIDVFIQVVYNGLEALEFLTCTGKFASQGRLPQPGIIFLDINMPVMNGWEFLTEYKKLPEEQKEKIVIAMLTSSVNEDDVLRAKVDYGLKDFINKPLRLAKLNSILDEYFVDVI